jgi:hypothetical protein
MLRPLDQYICDTCGEIIEHPSEGWIEWIRKEAYAHSFRITHHQPKSPLKSREGCYLHTSVVGRCDTHMDSFLSRLMPELLSFIDVGPYFDPEGNGLERVDKRSFAELARRLTIPYYEESRLYWSEAHEDGLFVDANELTMYREDFCKDLIKRYGRFN